MTTRTTNGGDGVLTAATPCVAPVYGPLIAIDGRYKCFLPDCWVEFWRLTLAPV